MSVYYLGSRCGRFLKVGQTNTPTPSNGRPSTLAKNGYYGVKYPHLLGYVRTSGNDKDAESRLHEQYNQKLPDAEAFHEEYGGEGFPLDVVLPHFAWLRLQYFCETDTSGTIVTEPISYEDFAPTEKRVSCDFREEDLTTRLEAESNPFWFLPDLKVDPDEDYFTPPGFIEPVKAAFGGSIPLDVASHPAANRYVRADRYFTWSMNGLTRPWDATSVWLSPRTKDDVECWLNKAREEIYAGRVSEMISLTGTRALASNYYRPHQQRASGLCIVAGGGPVFGGKGRLTENNSNDRWAFVYWGPNKERFKQAFEHLGTVWTR